MGFGRKVREDELVASARHCCACNRYKGLKIEVHHIIQEADGGENTSDNAIALCFDCHADAGHYNSRHPKGTRISPNELRKHKEAWHERVKTNNIQSPKSHNHIHVRYYVCKHPDVIDEISKGDLNHLPIENAVMLTTPPLEHLQTHLTNFKKGYRIVQASGRDSINLSEMHSDYPDSIAITEDDIGRTPFEFYRSISGDEFASIPEPDPITASLVEAGVDPQFLVRASVTFVECGSGGMSETYEFRPLWVEFLSITNMHDEPIHLSKLIGLAQNEIDSVSTFDLLTNMKPMEIALPGTALLPGESVIVPLSNILGPHDYAPAPRITFVEESIEEYCIQETAHTDLSAYTSETYAIGPRLLLQKVDYQIDDISVLEQVHENDLNNLYTIDRNWMMGSCPYMFYISAGGQYEFVRSLFNQPDKMIAETFAIIGDKREVCIAELEDEQTIISLIMVNDEEIHRGIILNKHATLKFKVERGDTVSIIGKYVPYASVPAATYPQVARFLRERFVVENQLCSKANPMT
jgi:hypothetical protein